MAVKTNRELGYALINNNIGNEKMWRKQDIIVDCVNNIIDEDPYIFSGNQLIDEVYLRDKGETNFEKYQCVPGFEPPTMNQVENWDNPIKSKNLFSEFIGSLSKN